MKKTLALGAASVLLLSLTACSPGTPEEQAVAVTQRYLNSSGDETPQGLCDDASLSTIAVGAEVIPDSVEDLGGGSYIVAFSQTDDPRPGHAGVMVSDDGACVTYSQPW